MKQGPPLGIKLICYIYLVNIALYLLALALFYNRIIVLGQDRSEGISWAIRIAFVIIPLYLYFRLKSLKQDAWILAVCFHLFFVINNFLGFLEYRGYAYSLIRTAGASDSLAYSTPQLLILALNVLVNMLVAVYLFNKRLYFYKSPTRH